MEQTVSMIKPDALPYIGSIIQMIQGLVPR